jgi:AcrR family transcriptional regulator
MAREGSNSAATDGANAEPLAPAPVAQRSVDRAIESRRAVYEDEVRRLVHAAFELIRQTGTLEPRVGEIVASAGLSNQAFYKHFRSKDELLLAVLDDGIRTLRGYIEHRMSKETSPERKVRSWIDGVLEQALNAEAASATRPFAMSRARLLDLFPDEVLESEAQLTRLLRDAIGEACESGELPGCDPERDARLVYNLAMGWLERELPDLGQSDHSDQSAQSGQSGQSGQSDQSGPSDHSGQSDKPAQSQADADHLAEFAMRGLARGGA